MTATLLPFRLTDSRKFRYQTWIYRSIKCLLPLCCRSVATFVADENGLNTGFLLLWQQCLQEFTRKVKM